jgi:hypothetical protein
VNLKIVAVVFGFLALLSAETISATDLHPIIEIVTGYFFGASENGKWTKADQQLSPSRTKQPIKFTVSPNRSAK